MSRLMMFALFLSARSLRLIARAPLHRAAAVVVHISRATAAQAIARFKELQNVSSHVRPDKDFGPFCVQGARDACASDVTACVLDPMPDRWHRRRAVRTSAHASAAAAVRS